ncbi:glycosyltransferase family 4 protein [Providencia manganoxydans]|nr:glycosyltransferase [Providencia rettgeri]
MKILIIGPFPEPIHGMSLANMLVYDGLLKNNKLKIHKHNTVIKKTLKEKSLQGKFDITYLLGSTYDNIKLLLKICFLRYDILYITPGQSVLGFLRFFPIILISKLLRTRTIQHIHGSQLRNNIDKKTGLIRNLCKINIYLTNKFIILSKTILKDYSSLIPPSKMEICCNGVKIQEDTSNYNNKDINVLYLSNLMQEKGIVDLLKAIECIDSDTIKFHFAGLIEPSIMKLCNDFFSKKSINCKYYGQVSGKKKDTLFRLADIFILPSYDEGVPLSILEAYSYSCAVITTPVGGIPDIFQNNINGIYSIPGDVKSIIHALNKVISNIDFYKTTNRDICKNNFSSEKFVSRIEKIILETNRVR